jgi:histone H3/H4
LRSFLKSVLRDSLILMEYSDRKTVYQSDVIIALDRNRHKMYI